MSQSRAAELSQVVSVGRSHLASSPSGLHDLECNGNRQKLSPPQKRRRRLQMAAVRNSQMHTDKLRQMVPFLPRADAGGDQTNVPLGRTDNERESDSLKLILQSLQTMNHRLQSIEETLAANANLSWDPWLAMTHDRSLATHQQQSVQATQRVMDNVLSHLNPQAAMFVPKFSREMRAATAIQRNWRKHCELTKQTLHEDVESALQKKPNTVTFHGVSAFEPRSAQPLVSSKKTRFDSKCEEYEDVVNANAAPMTLETTDCDAAVMPSRLEHTTSDSLMHSKMVQTSKSSAVQEKVKDEKPKQPRNPYQLFVQELRPTLSGSIGEIAKQLSRRWAELIPAEKKLYEDKALALKRVYESEMDEYNKSRNYIHNLAEF